jgi:hypothetical protein
MKPLKPFALKILVPQVSPTEAAEQTWSNILNDLYAK